jgi:TIR domain
MAYVTGYSNDIFVSYSHVDNERIEPTDHGWVDALMNALKIDIGEQLGRKDAFDVWRDVQSLQGNHQISEHVSQQARTSAVFLAVLSPGYLTSTYCLQELQAFLDRGDHDAANRLFVVHKHPIDESRHSLPEAFRDLRKYQFWIVDSSNKPRVFGSPLPQPRNDQDRDDFYPRVVDLAIEIVAQLTNLKEKATSPPEASEARSAESYSANVLLAEVTDDLGPRREEIRRYLNQYGVGALPTGSYHLGRAEFERACVADLENSACFVQLLGPHLGKTPPDIPEGYGRLQFDLAKRRGLPVLQWRDPELDIEKATSATQNAFLRSETVRAMPVEDFKRSIIAAIAKPDVAPRERSPYLFVDAAPADIDDAQLIRDKLRDVVDSHISSYDSSWNAESIQSDVEQALVECDALVLICGKAGGRWVSSQLLQYRKLAPRRKKEPRLLAAVGATRDLAMSIPIWLRGMAAFEISEAEKRIREVFTT